MANELKHGSVGTELTQAEWEAVGAHVIDSQAEGDIVYASSSAQLSRLGKGADNTVLHLASGIPAWSATLAGLTLTTPTISATGFANANHAHAAANSGGTLTTVGALDSGSITSGFGNIDNGSSTITTTGALSGGVLDIDSTGQSIVTRQTSASGAATTFGWTVMHETTQNMEAGFAVALAFRLKDDTSAAMNMARIDGAWNGADDTGKMTMYTYDSGSATASFDVLPGGIDMLNNTILNVGGSGNDWTGGSFVHDGLGTTSDAMSYITRTTGIENATTFNWTIVHKSTGTAGDGFGAALAFRIADVGGPISGSAGNLGRLEYIRAGADNTGDFQAVPYIAGAANTALKLTSAGVLSVDLSGSGSAAQVDLFDEYDDATELRRFAYSGEGVEDVVPGITEEQRTANRERMVEMGILTPVAGAASGYHMRIQPLTRLLAGGIYQNRHRMDSQYEELSKRLEAIGA